MGECVIKSNILTFKNGLKYSLLGLIFTLNFYGFTKIGTIFENLNKSFESGKKLS